MELRQLREWKEFVIKTENKLLINFIHECEVENSYSELEYADPRFWETVGNLLLSNVSQEIIYNFIKNTVGEGLAEAFDLYLDIEILG